MTCIPTHMTFFMENDKRNVEKCPQHHKCVVKVVYKSYMHNIINVKPRVAIFILIYIGMLMRFESCKDFL